MSRQLQSQITSMRPLSFRSSPSAPENSCSPVPATDLLIQLSQLRPDDHVLVIGRSVLNPILALSHHCASAAGQRSDRRVHTGEKSEIVWLTGVTDVDEEVVPVLTSLGDPRLIVIELVSPTIFHDLPHAMARLAELGFVCHGCHSLSDRIVITGRRPENIRLVA
jgi:hypothetical protein